MDVGLLERRGVDHQGGGLGLHQAQRRLHALAHYLAELAGEDQPAAAGGLGGLDEQDVAAHRRPGQAGGHARHRRAHGHFVLEAQRAQHRLDVVDPDPDLRLVALGDLHGGVAEGAADLPLQPADPGLAGVALDDLDQGRVVDGGLLGLEAIGLQLPADQIALGDLQLFPGRVAGQADDLHAVAQGAGHGVEHVGGGDEHHPRQVEGHGQVVVAEGPVLLGIQNLQHRRRRIALDARAHLVDLVQHHHAVASAGLADGLDDGAGQGADIGAAVAANLGLVVQAAQADADELAPHGLGDGLAERGLADPRRTGEAQDRRLALGRELAHGQELQDPGLDLLQAVVVGVEDLPRLLDVDGLGLGRRPGQLDQPVEVGADHAVFGAGVGHALQASQLLARLGLHLLGHGGLVDGGGQIGDLLVGALVFAQLVLDRGQLLAQQHVALTLAQGGLGLGADVPRQLQHFQAVGQKLGDLVQPGDQVEGLQDVLLLLGRDVGICGGHVGQDAGGCDRLHRRPQFRRRLGQDVQDLQGLLAQVQEPRLDLGGDLGGLGQVQAAGDQIGPALQGLGDVEALHALADDVVLAVGGGDVAQDVGHHADVVEVGAAGLLHRRVALQDHHHLALLAHRLLGGGDGGRAVDGQGDDDLGKEHGAADRHDDEGVGGRGGSGLLGGDGFGGCGFGHGSSEAQTILRRLTCRHPSRARWRTWS